MTRNRLGAFIEALVRDRRPKSFDADPGEAEMLRVAIALRAGRPGAGTPDERFVAELRRQLADDADVPFTAEEQVHARAASPVTVPSRPRSRRSPAIPRRVGLVGIAAAAFVAVGASAVVTNAVDHSSRATTAQVAQSATLRFASLRTPAGQTVGQVYVHQGDPSWMFMSMHGRDTDTTLSCELHLANGTTMQVGTVQLHEGTGQLAHPVPLNVSQLRRAQLVTSTGAIVASATFS
jgi:hypothetical protein